MTLQLKIKRDPDPTIAALLELRPRIRLKEFLAKNANNPYNEFDKRRREKILAYVERQAKRTEAEKENDYQQQISSYQNAWVEARIREPDSKWRRWWWSEDRPESQVIEEWVPWSRIDGEPINIWRLSSKK
jgi:hypothetical protein